MAISEVLSPLPSISADLAALDIAPLPGNIHTWVPEQNKVGAQEQCAPLMPNQAHPLVFLYASTWLPTSGCRHLAAHTWLSTPG